MNTDNYIVYLKSLNRSELENEIDTLIAETYHKILDDEAVNSEIASTNALGWGAIHMKLETLN